MIVVVIDRNSTQASKHFNSQPCAGPKALPAVCSTHGTGLDAADAKKAANAANDTHDIKDAGSDTATNDQGCS